jgi:hypothetical protein
VAAASASDADPTALPHGIGIEDELLRSTRLKIIDTLKKHSLECH